MTSGISNGKAFGPSGTPVVCQPLFTGQPPSGDYFWTSPTVTSHIVFVGGQAYDTAGTAGCSGTPTTCAPLWSVPSDPYSVTAVSNGRVYVGGTDGQVHVYAPPSS